MKEEQVPPRSAAANVVQKVDQRQLASFVTTIKSAEQQVGEHIITALQHDDTVAVLTTVVIDEAGRQRVISAALSPNLMSQVQTILASAEKEREPQEPCVGFHCLLKPKGVAAGDKKQS